MRETVECFDQPSRIIDKCVVENIKNNQLHFVKAVPNKILQYIIEKIIIVEC